MGQTIPKCIDCLVNDRDQFSQWRCADCYQKHQALLEGDQTAFLYAKIRALVREYVNTLSGWQDMVSMLGMIARHKRHLIVADALFNDTTLRMAAMHQDHAKGWQDHSEPADAIRDAEDVNAALAMDTWQKEDR